MTVKELRDLLGTFRDDVEILISSDEEGNMFKYLEDVGEFKFTNQYGDIEVYNIDEEVDADSDPEKCIVIWT